MPDTAHTPPARLAALDGLRGIAIILVVLSHGWVLWPMEFIDSHPWITPLFRGGNAAVSVFLVASGFLSYRVLASRNGMAGMQPLIALVRRVLRVGPALWVALITVLVVAAVDSTDVASKKSNLHSVLHVLTYTYNWYVEGHLLETRSDLGHLWYLSVDMQAFVFVAIVAYVLRRRPVALIATLSALFLLLVWWRFHVFGMESIWVVLNRTTARMDPFVLGFIAAAVSARLPRVHPLYRTASLTSLALMVPVLWWCDSNAGYMGWGGTVLEFLVAIYITTSALSPHRDWLITSPALVRLGQLSLLLYIWHFPILRFVQRHQLDWDWPWEVLLATALTVIATVLSEMLIERRVLRLLAHPNWQLVREHGLVSYLARSTRTQVTRAVQRTRA